MSRFVHICIQSLEKMQIRAKKNFPSKIQFGYQKTLILNPL